jgi:hypothetical protein
MRTSGIRIKHWLPYLAVGWCITVFAFGLLFYIDAPFKPCDPGPYCGKSHQRHTEQEFSSFQRWQLTLFLSWPFGMGACYVIKKRRDKVAPSA